jgi:hypothetical protein
MTLPATVPWRRLAIGLALASLALSGCRTVTITSEPPGASVRIDGQEAGATPLTCRVWQGLFFFAGEYRIAAEMPGYQPAMRRCREGTFGNVRTAVPPEIHFRLIPEPSSALPPASAITGRGEENQR